MARNEEKAMAALNRWTAQKRDLEMSKNLGKAEYMGGALPDTASFGPYKQKKRPKIASEVTTVKECEHWRKDILAGVAKKIAEIQNAALGEHRIRDLNDEINKDLREKSYWEDQIKALGGADYKAKAPKDVETYGAELASHTGYKYFGAAKDLPGVRELFETEIAPEAPRKTRKQLFKHIQPDYYGWRDEEEALRMRLRGFLAQKMQLTSRAPATAQDGTLLLAEQMKEHEAQKQEVERWKAEQAKKKAKVAVVAEESEQQPEEVAEEQAEPEVEKPDSKDFADFKAYVDVPTMEDIERLIIQKKKNALLKKYASSAMQQQSNESSELLAGGKEVS
eukprot:TRINITY_DN77202_c0_g1_i2.p2 TRINITY_DN77202_c0_g1~~TRINITY_DN77202_c0_g1_i2.p2  ORF type:complete len:336 (-),score=112.18 TRINITY_DN77202_c0_g1_i2:137-1144(-)